MTILILITITIITIILARTIIINKIIIITEIISWRQKLVRARVKYRKSNIMGI